MEQSAEFRTQGSHAHPAHPGPSGRPPSKETQALAKSDKQNQQCGGCLRGLEGQEGQSSCPHWKGNIGSGFCKLPQPTRGLTVPPKRLSPEGPTHVCPQAEFWPSALHLPPLLPSSFPSGAVTGSVVSPRILMLKSYLLGPGDETMTTVFKRSFP